MITLTSARPASDTQDRIAAQDHAATLLGRAFIDDPMFVTTLGDPVRRAAGLPLVFRAMVRQAAASGLIDTAPEGRGVALWMPGEAAPIRPRQIVRYGYLRFGAAAGLADAVRLGLLQDRILAAHREIIHEPHAYLFALGVEPGHQGEGVGSHLLRVGCERVDRMGLPAFLETNLPQNVRLYERFGFEVRGHIASEASRPFDTWLMVRPTRPAAQSPETPSPAVRVPETPSPAVRVPETLSPAALS